MEEFKCVWSLKSLHGFRESVPRGSECGSLEWIGQPDRSLRTMCLILRRKAPVIREGFYPGNHRRFVSIAIRGAFALKID